MEEKVIFQWDDRGNNIAAANTFLVLCLSTNFLLLTDFPLGLYWLLLIMTFALFVYSVVDIFLPNKLVITNTRIYGICRKKRFNNMFSGISSVEGIEKGRIKILRMHTISGTLEYSFENAHELKDLIQQLIENNNKVTDTPVPTEVNTQASVSNTGNDVVRENNLADEIMMYKKLLDNGAITQEEYEAKKKQLLGL